MFLGFAILALCVFVVVVLARMAPPEPPHGRGCDCGECSAWYIEKNRSQRTESAYRKRKKPRRK